MYKLTLDTNALINLFEFSADNETGNAIASIIRYALEGRAEIQITTRVDDDLQNDKDKARRRELAGRLYRMLPTLASGFRDASGLIDPDHQQIWDELRRAVFPTLSDQEKRYTNKVHDLDHLLAHYLNRRDVFVTSDRGILSKATTLRQVLGINVLTPDEALRDIDSRAQLERVRKVPHPRKTDYHNPLPAGVAFFDFTNNDSRFSIGSGDMMFETDWSVRNVKVMAAYNDPQSIEAIAVASGVSRLADLKPASRYDFTSRSRDVSARDILILKNVFGYYAALRIRSIEVVDRGGTKNELSFEYVIQSNKTDDFSDLKWSK